MVGAGRLKDRYWPLIKSRQTFMLTLTGIAGYISQRPFYLDWVRLVSLAGSLLICISGSTILNMVFDRDIDRKMARTSHRPLATGQVDPRKAEILGVTLIILGLAWALTLSPLYCALILAEISLDVLVYTIWLKRRSPWSIVLGGLSGGMPVLAGRVLALNRIDTAGLLLALAILCWIPNHNLSLDMLYSRDYCHANIPTFLSVYGLSATRVAIVISSLLTVMTMAAAFLRLDFPLIELAILGISGLGLICLAFYTLLRSAPKVINILFKYSSLYILIATLLIAVAVLA